MGDSKGKQKEQVDEASILWGEVQRKKLVKYLTKYEPKQKNPNIIHQTVEDKVKRLVHKPPDYSQICSDVVRHSQRLKVQIVEQNACTNVIKGSMYYLKYGVRNHSVNKRDNSFQSKM